MQVGALVQEMLTESHITWNLAGTADGMNKVQCYPEAQSRGQLAPRLPTSQGTGSGIREEPVADRSGAKQEFTCWFGFVSLTFVFAKQRGGQGVRAALLNSHRDRRTRVSSSLSLHGRGGTFITLRASSPTRPAHSRLPL